MIASHHPLSGLWLPLITPFRDGALDEVSLRRLIRHYGATPLAGLIVGATTGEALVLDEAEVERLVLVAADEAARCGRVLPLYLGLSGSNTAKMVKALGWAAHLPVDGYLIACPYYSRPSQEGLYRHFTALADQAGRPVVIYNIPYRTGVNLGNETMLRLAEHPGIIGVKDCCADVGQSADLIRTKPASFAVLTGEDAQYYAALTHGAEGAILASAHVETAAFAGVREQVLAGDWQAALAAWQRLVDLPRLLFAEPNPAPIKHWLWRQGLIDSPELRLPMTGITSVLAARLDQEIARRTPSYTKGHNQ